jgi:membrane fusion protein, heavy metal efflux system
MKFFIYSIAILMLQGVLAATPSHAADGHGHEEKTEEPVKGPHNGRLLEKDGFAIEITIFEKGVPPEFRLFAYKDGKPVVPMDFKARVTLDRLGGEKNVIEFAPEGDYLLGSSEVVEPHSFVVTVAARFNSKDYQWQYDSPEGRSQISTRAAEAAGIKTAPTGPADIHETLDLFARIELLPQNRFRVGGRYAGIVQNMAVGIGDRVKAGDVVATIENSNTLQSYSVKAPASGIVLERYVNKGDTVGSKPLLLIADNATVAIEMSVFAGDRARRKDKPS